MQAAIDTVQAIQPADDPERKHKHTSLSRRSLEAAVGIARTHPTMRVAADRLDANPHVLNTPGGVLNLRTGKTEPSAANEMHTRITRCAPDADCPVEQWLSYLAQTFDGREELIPFVQRLAGYSATGTTRHHILPFLLGPGKNGKSVFLDVLRTMLGTYAASSPSKFLMAGQQQHETEIARLSGLRLVICSEVNQSDKFDEAKVKVLTGGDGLTARFMNQNHFDFSPTHKLWLMGNHQPRVTGGGESFWRRLRVINFDNTVAPDKMIGDLAERLIEDEGPGILAWIAEGARLAYESGLQEPNSVLIATQTYAAEEDALARFVADRVHLGGGDVVRVKVSEVRSAYEEWCRSEGDQPLSSQVFGRELRIRYGIESKKSNGVRHYAGMTLYAADTDASAETHWSDR
jgi:putative DNA primase/helicase